MVVTLSLVAISYCARSLRLAWFMEQSCDKILEKGFLFLLFSPKLAKLFAVARDHIVVISEREKSRQVSLPMFMAWLAKRDWATEIYYEWTRQCKYLLMIIFPIGNVMFTGIVGIQLGSLIFDGVSSIMDKGIKKGINATNVTIVDSSRLFVFSSYQLRMVLMNRWEL